MTGNICRNALKKPEKTKNQLRNLLKKYVSEGICWTNCTTLLIYQRSLTNQNVECAQSHSPIFVNRTIIHNEKRRSDPCRKEGVAGQSRTPFLLFSQSCAFFQAIRRTLCRIGGAGQGHALACMDVDGVAHTLQPQAVRRGCNRVVIGGHVPVAGRAVDRNTGIFQRDTSGRNITCRGSHSKVAQKFRAVCGGFCAKREKVSTGYYASDRFVLK